MKNQIMSILLIMTLTTLSATAIHDVSVANSKSMVTGKIVDIHSGESVAGACITILETNTKVYTDLDGNYVISNLNAGSYTLQVNMISYKQKGEIKIVTTAGNSVDKNIVIESEL